MMVFVQTSLIPLWFFWSNTVNKKKNATIPTKCLNTTLSFIHNCMSHDTIVLKNPNRSHKYRAHNANFVSNVSSVHNFIFFNHLPFFTMNKNVAI